MVAVATPPSPYLIKAFHAALRASHASFVTALEGKARELLRHHLDAATSEFALSLMAAGPDMAWCAGGSGGAGGAAAARLAEAAEEAGGGENIPPEEQEQDVVRVAARAVCWGGGHSAAVWFPMPPSRSPQAVRMVRTKLRGALLPPMYCSAPRLLCPLHAPQASMLPARTPFRPSQMTVPETPSPSELTAQQAAAAAVGARRGGGGGGGGRSFVDNTPSKGRVAKAQRVEAGAAAAAPGAGAPHGLSGTNTVACSARQSAFGPLLCKVLQALPAPHSTLLLKSPPPVFGLQAFPTPTAKWWHTQSASLAASAAAWPAR
jgi:hypothetical protein